MLLTLNKTAGTLTIQLSRFALKHKKEESKNSFFIAII